MKELFIKLLMYFSNLIIASLLFERGYAIWNKGKFNLRVCVAAFFIALSFGVWIGALKIYWQ
jgi:hypothetical protein